MKFERFQNIIEYNCRNQLKMKNCVREFYFQMNMDYERELPNLMLMVRPLFNKKNYLVIELPFKDKEIGALCYKSDFFGYTFLNSALPKVNVNFALAHEIYHIFYQQESFKKKIELYMNEHYFEHKEELSANLFAGILLMPAPSFQLIFGKYKNEQDSRDTEVTLIAKIMSFFEVPYMAVVIRCYELGLLPDGDVLERLLKVDNIEIEKEFSRLWLNDEILKPTKRDDYPRLEQLVRNVGTGCKNKEILKEDAIQKVLENMGKIYNEIRG